MLQGQGAGSGTICCQSLPARGWDWAGPRPVWATGLCGECMGAGCGHQDTESIPISSRPRSGRHPPSQNKGHSGWGNGYRFFPAGHGPCSSSKI